MVSAVSGQSTRACVFFIAPGRRENFRDDRGFVPSDRNVSMTICVFVLFEHVPEHSF